MATVDYNRPCPSSRIPELARPTEYKEARKATRPWRKLVWGNQESIWTVTRAAKTAKPTDRMLYLAKPKKNHHGELAQNRGNFLHSCGQRSSIWKIPLSALNCEPSERLEKLAKPKSFSKGYQENRPAFDLGCGRGSNIWHVSPAALSYETSPRVLHLARPKTCHLEFKYDKQVETYISLGTRMASITPRLECLSIPKIKEDSHLFFDRGQPEQPIRPVSKPARKALATSRIQQLAKQKEIPSSYLPERDVMWAITSGAGNSSASSRTEELAKPIMRQPMDMLQYDTEAFKVREAAKKSMCTQRIKQLAEPIQR
ncbi:testicular haploid expressed gene protein-like [Acipenser oxyrinchus oxyrinchus]|uniref:Testicular haploid expressed gene protein-like n=1 Tax=Acipenser oxyrinchus oxyrinchus TaxID=40147 RepID=A0AAD8GJQ1_ACIOX|nr:testicular haploid expressed gene protein-like [Acipenser oxyrinchus oxyrinchus]